MRTICLCLLVIVLCAEISQSSAYPPKAFSGHYIGSRLSNASPLRLFVAKESMEEIDESESDLDEAVSSFIVYACRAFEKESSDEIFKFHPKPGCKCYQVTGIMLDVGSAAEFYITPGFEGPEDINKMHYPGNRICYFDKIPSMSHDLRYFHDEIQCLRIVSTSDYSGYCRLKEEGNLIYDWNSKKYNFVPIAEPYLQDIGTFQYKRESVISPECESIFIQNITKRHSSTELYDPAVKNFISAGKHHSDSKPSLPINRICCDWCPHWPKEAMDWPYRSRNNGWPTDATIRKVVKEGCYIVRAKHNEYEEPLHRYSFSHAEVVLLYSWTPTQQVVYHMLRYFAKRELIQKNCPKEKEALCSYHLKTLMLWTCEEKPVEWWNTNTVVEICRKLLITLSDWLRRRYFPNYFIPTANLICKKEIDHSINFALEKITHFCRPNKLHWWFLKLYCRPIFEFMFKTSVMTVDITTINECTARISESTKSRKLLHLNLNLFQLNVSCMSYFTPKAIEFCANWNLGFQCPDSEMHIDTLSHLELNSYSLHHASALLLLHAEYAITCIGMKCDNTYLVDLLIFIGTKCKQICRKCHNFPQPYRIRLQKSHVMFTRAQELMELLTGPLDDPEFLLCCRISMILLKECLEIQDSKSDSIRHAALAYMSSLSFANEEFQTSQDLCSTVIESQDSSEAIEALNAGCLLYFDDIANITGLFLLWKYCQDLDFLQNHQLSPDLRLTPHIFAIYLIWLLGQSHLKPFPEIKMPERCRNLELYALDVFLILAMRQRRLKGLTLKDCKLFMNVGVPNHQINESSPTVLSKGKFPDEIDIVPLLLVIALKRMEDFNSMVFQRMGFQLKSIDCYRALYFYKYHRYDDVFCLCDNILEQPDTGLGEVLVLPPYDSFFDSDIQCLLGLKTLYHFLYNKNVRWNLAFSDSQLEWRRASADFVKSGKPLIKMGARTGLKDQDAIGRHFLVKYLKLRCLIICNGTHAGIWSAISEMNCRFPFEHLIAWFLRQKFKRKPKSSTVSDVARR